MVLCTRCGFEKDGVLCSEAAGCTGRCAFEPKEEQVSKPFAEYTVKVFVKPGVPADTDEEINALADRLDDFLGKLEGLTWSIVPAGFQAEVAEE